jgi:hypothetical protein
MAFSYDLMQIPSVRLNLQVLGDQPALMMGQCHANLISRLYQTKLNRLAPQENGTIGGHFNDSQALGQLHADFALDGIYVLNSALGVYCCNK